MMEYDEHGDSRLYYRYPSGDDLALLLELVYEYREWEDRSSRRRLAILLKDLRKRHHSYKGLADATGLSVKTLHVLVRTSIHTPTRKQPANVPAQIGRGEPGSE